MHELGITESMLKLVLEQANKAGASKVKTINLVISQAGEVTEESVRFYFDIISRGTIAGEATLSFTLVPTMAQCQTCKRSFEIKEFVSACPSCSSADLRIVAGPELQVESVEIE